MNQEKSELDEPGGKRNGNGKKTDLTVYVFNAVEDEWSFISSVADDKQKFELIEDTEAATDCFFLSMATESEFVYISPKPISSEFQAYAQELLGYKSAEVLVPAIRSHLICDDFLRDSKALVSFVTRAKQYRRVVLLSYAATLQFYGLKRKLQKLGIEVYTPEAPRYDSAWTVGFYGSKSGIRQLAQKSVAVEPDFVMPEGLICVGRHDAAKIAANRYIKQKGVVIKTNKGSGGNGVLIFREGELPADYEACEEKLLEVMGNDSYWDNYPIVIEDLININYGAYGGMPNVEFKIHKNGRIEMLYVCACQVTPKGVFYGVDINEDIITDRMQTRIEDTGYYIAEQYSAAGYRGHFDVDMVYAKNGQVYVVESNTRNTGGTDAFKIVKKLLGKDFMDDGYTVSRSRHAMLPPGKYRFDDIYMKVGDLLFSKKTGEGVVINSESSIPNGKLIYMAIGKNKKRAYEMEEELERVVLNEY